MHLPSQLGGAPGVDLGQNTEKHELFLSLFPLTTAPSLRPEWMVTWVYGRMGWKVAPHPSYDKGPPVPPGLPESEVRG